MPPFCLRGCLATHHMKKLFIFYCLTFAAKPVLAQSTINRPAVPNLTFEKKKKVYSPDSTHSPSLAVKRSAIVPGWGQLYNHKWWKLPLVYAGLGEFGYGFFWNRNQYKTYLRVRELRKFEDKPVATDTREVQELYTWASRATPEQLENRVNYHQRNLQLCILGFAGFWGLQLIDTYIDAKFRHSYTMDRDLGFSVAPGIQNTPMYANNNISSVMPVIKVTFTVK